MDKKYLVNQQIRSPRVLLIDDEGKMLGEKTLSEALALAAEKGLDVVEVGPNQNPPVCRIMDWGKFFFEQQKAERKQKVKGKGPEIKEIRLGVKIGDHDLMVKTNQAKKFLEKGDKVKVTVILRGREMIFKDRADGMIERFRELSEGEIEGAPSRLGNRISAVITKKKS